MNKVAALLIFGCLAITVCAQTKTRQCRGKYALTPTFLLKRPVKKWFDNIA